MRTRHFFSHNWFRTLITLSALSTLALCPPSALAQTSKRINPADKATLDALKEKNKGILAPGAPAPESGKVVSDWSIVIVAARGENARASAEAAAEKVRTKGGLPEAYAEQRGEAWVVAFGRYPSFEDKDAQRDLERIKATKIDNEQPFAGAVLSPPLDSRVASTMPQYDLGNLKAKQGKAAAYSVQVGVYDAGQGRKPTPEDIKLARESAEKAVVQLRREGEEAYFFHGPLRSMVTIGVFANAEVESSRTGTPVLSERIKQVRKRFPYNLVNGQGLKVRNETDKEGRLQPSFVVAVP